MPVFYFDFQIDQHVTRDPIGAEVETADMPREAAAVVASHVRDLLPVRPYRLYACEVGDETGRPCHRAEVQFRSFPL